MGFERGLAPLRLVRPRREASGVYYRTPLVSPGSQGNPLYEEIQSLITNAAGQDRQAGSRKLVRVVNVLCGLWGVSWLAEHLGRSLARAYLGVLCRSMCLLARLLAL